MLHLLRVIEAQLWRDGRVVWEVRDRPNVLHDEGTRYCLRALFNTSVVGVAPFYYAGLDNRVAPAVTDLLSELTSEPSTFGYQRVAINSSTGFVVTQVGGIYQATSGVLTFNATGGTWGPVQNLFLATTNDNTGVLISTVQLDGPHFVNNAEKLTMRVGVSLRDCP